MKVVEPVIFGFPGSTLIPQRSLSQDLGQTYIYTQESKEGKPVFVSFYLLFVLFCLRRRQDTDDTYKTVQFTHSD